MSKNLIFILLCLMCNVACKSHTPRPVDEIVVIDMDSALRSIGTLRMSDFVDSISYIPIYDGNSAYIGDPSRMEMTDNHILIYDMMRRLVLYNFRDRTSRQIGVRGRGPQEYLEMVAFAADEANNVIYALRRDDPTLPSVVTKYDFEGNFLDNFPLEAGADNIGLTDEGHLVVHFTNHTGNGKTQYLVMDDRGNTITSYPNPFSYRLSDTRHTWFHESAKYSYNGDVYIKDKSDTLYVFHGRERHPRYVFKNPFSLDGRRTISQIDYDSAFVFNNVFETYTKLVFNGYLGGLEFDKWRYFYYDKTTKQTHLTDRSIPNDRPGFPRSFVQSHSDTVFDDHYVKIIPNAHSTMPGYPQDEAASYFLMMFRLK